ncbi:hypothetical protein FRC08_006045 [Ceratobasidium sp. 394]|nr:hypothetical protein FRC08_006045 [Ceratobasidium sp. 394]
MTNYTTSSPGSELASTKDQGDEEGEGKGGSKGGITEEEEDGDEGDKKGEGRGARGEGRGARGEGEGEEAVRTTGSSPVATIHK